MNFARIPQLHHGLAGVGVGPSPPPHHRAPDRSSVGVARTAASAYRPHHTAHPSRAWVSSKAVGTPRGDGDLQRDAAKGGKERFSGGRGGDVGEVGFVGGSNQARESNQLYGKRRVVHQAMVALPTAFWSANVHRVEAQSKEWGGHGGHRGCAAR